MALPEPGQLFVGKYTIVENIGSGGFAEVYKATDPSGRPVAIKLLVPLQAEWAQNDPIMERFEREGELLGRLKNEHTVTMLDMGRTEDQSPYIVFEYVDGSDLAEIIETRGTLPPDRVVQILRQVCLALGEAHDLGVMHRDIKPANIMVYQHMGVSGLVKLLDFGIAKPTEGMGASQNLTSAGMVLGTPRYMAPEQFTGARAAPTSDIYSLGLVAYEALTGDMAVDAETTTGIFRQQLSPEEFTIPRGAGIPPGLRHVITKMTRKMRAERYQTVREVIADLDNLDRVQAPQKSRVENKKQTTLIAIGVGLILAIIVALAVVMKLAVPTDYEQREGFSGPRPTPEKVAHLQTKTAEPKPIADEPAKPAADPPKHGSDTIAVKPLDKQKPAAPVKPAEPKMQIVYDDDGNALPPPDDDIEPLIAGSAASAKSAATQAFMMGDFERVIAICKPYADELTFCARWLADAYRSLGKNDHACYWFEVVDEEKTGLNCPYEKRRRQDEMNERVQR